MRIIGKNKKGQKIFITVPHYDDSHFGGAAPDVGGGGGPDIRLILDWDLQNLNSYPGSGNTITDLQGNINGTLNGVILYTSGTPNYLMVEGDATEYIVTATGLNSKLNPVNTSTVISVFMWVYPTTNGVILDELGQITPNSGWHDSTIELVSGTLKFRLYNGSALNSSIPISLNNWYYIGFTYDGTTLTAYVDGVVAGTQTVSRLTPYNNGGSRNLFYALGPNDSTNLGDGTGADFRFGALKIYNTTLTANEVLDNYNYSKSPYI